MGDEMFDIFIIEKIREEEERRRRESHRPYLENPFSDQQGPPPGWEETPGKKSDRGVVIIEPEDEF